MCDKFLSPRLLLILYTCLLWIDFLTDELPSWLTVAECFISAGPTTPVLGRDND